MDVNTTVLLAGILGALPLLLAARRYGSRLPLLVYMVLLAGTATVLGHPHDYRTGTMMHGLVALTGTAFLWFTYTGHKQVERVRTSLQETGVVRVDE